MTTNSTENMIAIMLNEYDMHTGSRAAGGVMDFPERWIDCTQLPFYAAAARMLVEIRSGRAALTPEERVIDVLVNQYPSKFDDEYGRDPVLHIRHESGEMEINVPAMLEKITKSRLAQLVAVVKSDFDDDRRRMNRLKMQTYFYQGAALAYIESRHKEEGGDMKAARRFRNTAEKYRNMAESC